MYGFMLKTVYVCKCACTARKARDRWVDGYFQSSSSY